VSAIPPPLREAIFDFCETVPGPEIARRAAFQSAQYRSGSVSQITGSADIAAYLTARLPATFAAVSAALNYVRERAPGFQPASMLDFGAGPGTASWAAVEIWPRIQSIHMKDRSERFLAAAKILGSKSEHCALRQAEIQSSTSFQHDEHYDLVVAAYVISELSNREITDVTARLWNHCRGVLVIVEPGTPNGYQRILRSRQASIEQNAIIAAPCAGNEPCPLASPDWCHFAVRLPRSRDHMRAKGAHVPYEDEKYSYIAAVRESVLLMPASSRIISPVASTKAGLRFRLCTGHGISDEDIPHRNRAAYRLHIRKRWGDAI
jgi:ribosomal protein RSM22 (predicted rRNA methylase)